MTELVIPVKVEIENSYTDGHESNEIVEVPPPASMNCSDIETWWEDVVFEHTGDGHYVRVFDATGERLGSCYTATVIVADALPDLVGRTHEWLD